MTDAYSSTISDAPNTQPQARKTRNKGKPTPERKEARRQYRIESRKARRVQKRAARRIAYQKDVRSVQDLDKELDEYFEQDVPPSQVYATPSGLGTAIKLLTLLEWEMTSSWISGSQFLVSLSVFETLKTVRTLLNIDTRNWLDLEDIERRQVESVLSSLELKSTGRGGPIDEE